MSSVTNHKFRKRCVIDKHVTAEFSANTWYPDRPCLLLVLFLVSQKFVSTGVTRRQPWISIQKRQSILSDLNPCSCLRVTAFKCTHTHMHMHTDLLAMVTRAMGDFLEGQLQVQLYGCRLLQVAAAEDSNVEAVMRSGESLCRIAIPRNSSVFLYYCQFFWM